MKGEAAKIHVFGFLCFLKLSCKMFTQKYVVLSILNMKGFGLVILGFNLKNEFMFEERVTSLLDLPCWSED